MANYKVNITGIDTGTLIAWPSAKTLEAIGRYKNKEITIDDIVVNNLKLVLSSIQEFKNNKTNLDDIFQVGVLGLIKAIDNFDLSREVMFSTYAVPMIKGEVRRYVRDSQTLAKVSRQIKDLAYKVMAAQDEYAQNNGEEAPVSYLEDKLQVSGYEIKEALDSLSPMASLEDSLTGDDDLLLLDVVPYDKENVEKMRNHFSLKQGLENLKELERNIIYRRYYDGLTQMEIAEEFAISQAQVSRLEKNALRSLKKFF